MISLLAWPTDRQTEFGLQVSTGHFLHEPRIGNDAGLFLFRQSSHHCSSSAQIVPSHNIPKAYGMPETYLIPKTYSMPKTYLIPKAYSMPEKYLIPKARNQWAKKKARRRMPARLSMLSALVCESEPIKGSSRSRGGGLTDRRPRPCLRR